LGGGAPDLSGTMEEEEEEIKIKTKNQQYMSIINLR
jgi:hypothetical protein